jgi:hypothetical protein
MSRAELERWYFWLINSQANKLQEEQNFCFAQVSQGQNKDPLNYPSAIKSRPSACNLVWSPQEKLYAIKVQGTSQETKNTTSWNNLPLAWTHLVYRPFSQKVEFAMSRGCLPEYETAEMVVLMREMEDHGPAHVSALNEVMLSSLMNGSDTRYRLYRTT